MKKLINFLTLLCLLFTLGCDSDSSPSGGGGSGGSGSSGGSGGSYVQPDPIEVAQMTIDTTSPTRSFDQDEFITQLANQLEIDEDRIVIVNITIDDNSVILDLYFEESDDANATSVADLMATTEELEEIAGYSVSVEIVELNDCDSADVALNIANTMLTALSIQLHDCDHGNDDACLSDDPDTFPFVDIYEQYETARAYGADCSAAHEAEFGMGLLSMFTVTQDQILIDVLDAWQDWEDYESYFVMDRNSNKKIRSGLPIGISDLATLSNIKYSNYIPIKFVFNKLNQTMSNNRDHHSDNAPNFSDVQTIAREVLIPKITNTISHFDNILGKDFIFTITPDMQNDMYTDPVELDDAEIYVMKAFMHQLRSLLYALSTYNLDFICAAGDIEDCGLDLSNLDQDGDWLTLNDGAEDFFANAHDDLNYMLTSLMGAHEFLFNAGYHENGILAWEDIQSYNSDNDETMSDLFEEASDYINNTQVVEMCTEDEWVYDSDVNNEYEYNNEYIEGTCYDKEVDLSTFMNNPIENWKDIFPPYEVEWEYDNDLDIDDHHAETENYNFNDGCFDISDMQQSTIIMSQEDYMTNYRNYWFWPNEEGMESTVHMEEAFVTIDVSNVQFPNDYDFIAVSIGYDWEDNTVGYIYSSDTDNPTFNITSYFNNNNYDASSFNYTRIILTTTGYIEDQEGGWSVDEYVEVSLSFTYQDYPRLEYFWYSEECWSSDEYHYEELGYGCGHQQSGGGSENNDDVMVPYPQDYADGNLLCQDYHGIEHNLECDDCTGASTFANQIYANMLADELDFTFIRLIYFPNGSWYKNEPHWDYDVFYWDEDMEPCLTWEADNFGDWQDGWSNWQLNGLFPDMSKNEFFDFLEINDHDWEKHGGGCDE